MKLVHINIENYRSIERIQFDITAIDGGHTYTLIGTNESGKSNFLKAISLVNGQENVAYPRDFFDATKPVVISRKYEFTPVDDKILKDYLRKLDFDEEILAQLQISTVEMISKFDPIDGTARQNEELISFGQRVIPSHTYAGGRPVPRDIAQALEHFDFARFFSEILPTYFHENSHRIVFWKSDSKHLINSPIDLSAFATNPQEVSIPLLNCFALAGIDDIQTTVTRILPNPSEAHDLQMKLGDKVTEHIRRIWPNHPISIAFQINGNMISFLVEDFNVKYESKSTDQRSDGFRQFISFLLTISAESAVQELANTLVLLDEPETHLHPQAQENLMDELINLTKNDLNNIVFFATHSNNMIDKTHIDRCYRVQKPSNKETTLVKIEGGFTTYPEVNYEIFELPSTDYHNELYGYLEAQESSPLVRLIADRVWINVKSNKTEPMSLSKYIRNSIHHPENTSNTTVTISELKASIEILRELRRELEEIQEDTTD